jgi:hypothetical protein
MRYGSDKAGRRTGSRLLAIGCTIPRKTFPRERPSMRWLFAGRSWRVGSLTQKGATTTYVVAPSL